MDYIMKDIILQCACCHKEITDLSAAGWRNGERRSFECPECGWPDQGRGRGLAQVVLRRGGDMARIVPAGPAERLRDVVRLRRRPARLRGRRSLAAANWPLCGSRRSMATRRRPDCTSPSTAGRCPYPSTPEWSRRRPPRPSGSASRPSDTRRRRDDCQRPCILRLLLGRHCGTGAVAGGRAARIRLPRVRMRQLRDAGH